MYTINQKRGFVTVATGKFFYRLAKNLAMSYRLFSEQKYPFCVITDKKGAKKLKKYFDDVVVCKEPHYSYLDKMAVYELSPYEETVFIDADSSIVNDISFVFDSFYRTGSVVSCLGDMRKISETTKPYHHFKDAAIQKFGLTEFILFNGGVYYYRKSELADKMMRFIFNDLIPNYDLYELTRFAGKKADEPLIHVAMLCFGQKSLENKNPSCEKSIMKCAAIKPVKWDMKSKTCSAIVYEKWPVSPLILHYGSYSCSTAKYYYLNAKVRARYRKLIPPFSAFVIAIEMMAWLVNALTQKTAYHKDKMEWFKGHFTKEYFKNFWKRFKKSK